MENEQEKTCEQRISDQLKSRLSDIIRDTSEYNEEQQEEFFEHLCNLPLSIEKTQRYTILLSWGGPSDGFYIDFKDGECTGGQYFFQDWFDGATRNLSYDEAEAIAEAFCVGPQFE